MFTETPEMQAISRQVKKSNDLIQKSRFDLTLQQQKIVLYLISQISPYDEDFKLYEFSISEFCKICGIAYSGKNLTDLKAAIKEIADKSIWMRISEDKETLLRWIEKPYIEEQDGIVRIKLDNDMKPFLLQLKNNFTSYELIWVLHFKSKYSVRLYELIKSIHFHDLDEYTREFPLDELRKQLDAEKYTAWINLRQRVLEPAIAEINEYSDKNITMQPIKRGRSVNRVKFTITSKDTLEALQLRDRIMKEMGYQQMTLWDELESRDLI